MTGKTLGMVIGLVAVVGVAAVGLAVLVVGVPPAAPSHPPSAPAPAPTSVAMKYSATLYRALIEQDARTAGVAAPSIEELAQPFPYFDELPAKRTLRPGGTLRTPHLSLSAVIRRVEGAVEGQSFRADHLILKIENLTNRHLAYRVTTRVPDAARCEAKGVIDHDGIALGPRQSVLRTECLLQKAAGFDVVRVETIEIPPLSHYYVSRLAPGLILYDIRTSAGHTPGQGTICPQTFSWRDIRDGAARGEIDWRDIIDFYARHSCDEYTFFPGYRYRTDAAAALPARAALGAQP